MSILVIKPGMLSSFQDLGRTGYQHLGVPVGGAMDSRAHRLANLLVGNDENEATLEVTLTGPTLRFDAPACIAICGAQLNPTLNKEPVPNNRPLIVRRGDILAFGARAIGLRAYIAWHGGIALTSVMASHSTYLRGGFGGYQGRALRKDDTLTLNVDLRKHNLDELAHELWQIKVYLPSILGMNPKSAIRTVRGAHAPLFTDASVQSFFSDEYQISPQSERMGYRLQGTALKLLSTTQLLSEATSFGSVQVPPDGKPIILMADRQTTGGYAKIAHVATVDLPFIAQGMPGETLRFMEISLEQAQQLDARHEDAFAHLRLSLAPLRELFA
ncbi:biotin-dependent carboxyltransferase family protein [Pollutimonas harenae]|uniref:Biotin-dependent carboxyltransferase family protein n=1 Tax=Pollutimonas harenae TaxID=657015 RepID=A0A853GQ21_9BURK|nr:biotin-dependent carboxyltransferase family protein [Pollutimonas harenae]NYT84211.1 biotin-dependent carboxyltransferase family protein [Pollutimonas harenae]TEA73374.1 biotin-dependent carboxyltransferase family protein [Pollutimonas harenae]